MKKERQGADRRTWFGLWVVVSGVFMVVADASIINVAFPELGEKLNASDELLIWVVSGYNISVASFLLLSGRMADRYGRRRLFEWGIILFTVGSLLCGLAPTAETLVVFRILQGIGGATIFPASLALAIPSFPVWQRATAIGIWGAMGGVGAAFGPGLGGILLNAFGWRSIFFINIPIGIIILIFSHIIFKESKDTSRVGKLDTLGVPAGTIGIALIMVGLVLGENLGYFDYRPILVSIVGVLLIPFSIYRSKVHPSPLLDLSLFKVRSFSVTSISAAFFGLAFLAGYLLLSKMLQDVWGWSIIKAGLGLSISALISAVVAVFSGPWSGSRGQREVISVGAICSCLAYVYLLVFATGEPDFWGVLFPVSVLLGIGVGLAIASFTSGSLRDLDPELFVIGNATSRTTQQLSYALGVTVVVLLSNNPETISGFQSSFIWVAVFFGLSSVVMALFFPSHLFGLKKHVGSKQNDRKS